MFCQLYIHDTHNELQNRMAAHGNVPHLGIALLEPVVALIQDLLHIANPFVHLFRTAAERLRDNPASNLRLIFLNPKDRDRRTQNRPAGDEIGGIIVNDGTGQTHERDIILQRRGGNELERISYMNETYLPLQYPLVFPCGDLGWNHTIKKIDPLAPVQDDAEFLDEDDEDEDGDHGGFGPAQEGEGQDDDGDPDLIARKHKTVSLKQFFAYRLFERRCDGISIRYAGRLFLQLLVDFFACIEQSRLLFLRLNQKQIRGDLYNGMFCLPICCSAVMFGLFNMESTEIVCFTDRPSRHCQQC